MMSKFAERMTELSNAYDALVGGDAFRRTCGAICCLAMALGLLWRGQTYIDPNGHSMVTPVMCALGGLFFTITALAVYFRHGREAEAAGAAD